MKAEHPSISTLTEESKIVMGFIEASVKNKDIKEQATKLRGRLVSEVNTAIFSGSYKDLPAAASEFIEYATAIHDGKTFRDTENIDTVNFKDLLRYCNSVDYLCKNIYDSKDARYSLAYPISEACYQLRHQIMLGLQKLEPSCVAKADDADELKIINPEQADKWLTWVTIPHLNNFSTNSGTSVKWLAYDVLKHLMNPDEPDKALLVSNTPLPQTNTGDSTAAEPSHDEPTRRPEQPKPHDDHSQTSPDNTRNEPLRIFYAKENENLEEHYENNKDLMAEGIEMSIAMIEETVDLAFNQPLEGKKRVLILGMGHAKGIPLQYIAEKFDEVTIIELNQEVSEKALKNLPKNLQDKCEILSEDLTGIADEYCTRSIEALKMSGTEYERRKVLLEIETDIAAKVIHTRINVATDYACVISDRVAVSETNLLERFVHTEAEKLSMSKFYLDHLESEEHKALVESVAATHVVLLEEAASKDGVVYCADQLAWRNRSFDLNLKDTVWKGTVWKGTEAIVQQLNKSFAFVKRRKWDLWRDKDQTFEIYACIAKPKRPPESGGDTQPDTSDPTVDPAAGPSHDEPTQHEQPSAMAPYDETSRLIDASGDSRSQRPETGSDAEQSSRSLRAKARDCMRIMFGWCIGNRATTEEAT